MVDKIQTATFTEAVDGKEIEFMVRRPNMKQEREGQKVYNRAFNDAISSKALLRMKLDDFMKEQKLWDDDKQGQLVELGKQSIKIERDLARGGIALSAAKKLALRLKGLREDVRELISKRTELDVHTAEGQADNAKFNYFVSVCLVYNKDQKPVFDSVDSYIEHSTDEHAAAGATKLAQLLYELNEDYDSKLEENKFLREFGFADKQNRLINKDGHLVNADDKLVDDKGNLVNEAGDRVDLDGLLLDSDNNYIFERQPFTDDEGNPVESVETVAVTTEEAEETEEAEDQS